MTCTALSVGCRLVALRNRFKAPLFRFRYPDPFVPLESKLELFEANDIGHVLSQKKVVLREDADE